MQRSTRLIGLSLGADICWPGAYEQLVRKLNLELTLGDETVDFAVERVMVEPFNLRQPCRYDVVLDRLTHWFHSLGKRSATSRRAGASLSQALAIFLSRNSQAPCHQTTR